MISLKTRAIWGMGITVVCLVAGIVLLCSARDSFDHAFQASLMHMGESDPDQLNQLDAILVVGLLPGIGGACLTILGVVLFPLFLATWIRNPPPGSKLGFRGWKTPDQMTESDRAQEKAWRAILWGQLGTQPWLIQFGFQGYRSLLAHYPFTLKFLYFLICFCSVFYALGIRLCFRRDPAWVAAAPRSWKFALAINYGGLLLFLIFIGIIFFLRSRA